ncbi:unnamed protein product [Amaranthus hypochondriacus]
MRGRMVTIQENNRSPIITSTRYPTSLLPSLWSSSSNKNFPPNTYNYTTQTNSYTSFGGRGGGGRGGSNDSISLKASNYTKDVIVFYSTTKWREYFQASKTSNNLVVIYFTATWCGPCRYMEPTIKELAAKYADVDLVKIDVDQLFDVSGEFGVQVMPTFLFMKNGKEIDKVVGAKKEDLQRKVEKHRT